MTHAGAGYQPQPAVGNGHQRAEGFIMPVAPLAQQLSNIAIRGGNGLDALVHLSAATSSIISGY
jgi:hypothetical protein